MAAEDPLGKINIANTVQSKDDDKAPEGSGVLAIMEFRVLDEDCCTKIELSNVAYMDPVGAGQIPQVDDRITKITNAFVNHRTICAVSDMADCPVGCTKCVKGIVESITTLGECGEVRIVAGTYDEDLTVNDSIILILNDDSGAVDLTGSGY